MMSAKVHVVQRTTQRFQNIIDDDFFCRFCQDITALVTRSAVDKALDPQPSRQLSHIVRTYSLRFAELGNAHAILIFTTGNTQQNAQAVFFLCSYLHMTSYKFRSPSFTWYLSSI